MAIKKAYEELIAFLEANKDKKVSAILDNAKELCSRSFGGGGSASNCIKDDKGVVTHIFCYYHKMWEAVNPDGKGDKTHVEYGKKANSTTGFNSMCKEGTSAWTKQQRIAKKANEDLLIAVSKEEVKPNQIIKKQEDIQAIRAKIDPRKDKLGSKTKPGEKPTK